MSKTIGIALSLKDMFSPALKGAMDNAKRFTEEAKKVTGVFSKSNWSRDTRKSFDALEKSFNSINNKFNSVAKTALKFGAVIGGVLGGITLKSGFEEAFNMEGFRVQLETATKSTQKASQLMTKAVKFANSTPFETNEVVQATALMESYGISSERWLKDVADMAGATNKSIEQSTEAMADVAVGEFERLKQFGIKKDQILLESNKRYGEGVVFNNKGQVLDQAKLMDTVQAMMQQKFGGGAEKLANTTKGMFSTISGITKSTMAQILGVAEDGTIKQGSLMDKLREKVKQVGDALQKWQEDGTIKKVADSFTEGFTKVWNVLSKTFNFIKEHKATIKVVLETALAYMVLVKSFLAVLSVVRTLGTAFDILKTIMLNWKVTLIVAGIMALVAVGVILYNNWDKVKEKAQELWNKIKQVFTNINNKIKEVWNNVITSTINFFSNIWGKITSFFTKCITNTVNFFTKIGTSIANFFSKCIAKVVAGFTKVVNVIKAILTPIARVVEAIFKGILAVIILVCHKIYTTVSKKFHEIVDPIAEALSQIWALVTSKWNSIKETIVTVCTDIWTNVTTKWNSIKESIHNFCSSIWETVMTKWNSIRETIGTILNGIKEVVGTVWNDITSKIGTVINNIKETLSNGFNAAKEIVVGIFSDMKETVLGIFESIWGGIKGIINIGIGMMNGFIGGVNKVIGAANKVPGVNIGAVQEIPKFASGTQYAPKGLALINEKGGELRQLRGGETIIPADKSKQLLQGKGVGQGITLNFTIQGNVIGNKEFMEETGEYITNKVKMALVN